MPEAAKAQYYAGRPEQAFHLSRPMPVCSLLPSKPGFTKKAKEASARLRLNFKANKYDHGLRSAK